MVIDNGCHFVHPVADKNYLRNNENSTIKQFRGLLLVEDAALRWEIAQYVKMSATQNKTSGRMQHFIRERYGSSRTLAISL